VTWELHAVWFRQGNSDCDITMSICRGVRCFTDALVAKHDL
jgi:hypothetical protein